VPVDYYPNLDVEALTALLEKLQGRQTGGTITEFSAAGVRTVKTVEATASRVETEILRVLYALYLRARGTAEAAKWVNPYTQKISRTRARYTFS
jgi:hypothetical protein